MLQVQQQVVRQQLTALSKSVQEQLLQGGGSALLPGQSMGPSQGSSRFRRPSLEHRRQRQQDLEAMQALAAITRATAGGSVPKQQQQGMDPAPAADAHCPRKMLEGHPHLFVHDVGLGLGDAAFLVTGVLFLSPVFLALRDHQINCKKNSHSLFLPLSC